MAVYRIYLVHDDGRLEPDKSFYCKTDAQALEHLKPSPREDIRAELWQGGRFVAIAFSRADRSHRAHASP